MKALITFVAALLLMQGPLHAQTTGTTPTSSNQLLVSTHHHVWLADMQTGAFTPFEPLKNHVNIKSANYNATTGALVYTIAEESWWTHHVYGVNPDFRIEVPDIRAYKVRVVQAR